MHSSIAVPGKDIVFTDFEEEGMIVDLNTKQYFKLNETAALIWRNLERAKPIDEIVAELQSRYEVTSEHATSSIERLLEKLAVNNLVQIN
jgi:hypothetical protein